ncbi:hypothetical protein [Reichenbachiella sp.]|uniref:hypothetical protein n=1 Tax=Reichenbachiella sp. TaxID=2184521 RepID=UPI003B5AAF26
MSLLAVLLFFSFSVIDEIQSIREQYLEAALDKEKIELFKTSCSETTSKHASLVGYCTMIHFLEAKNAFNPYKKLSSFNMGRKTLDSLILTNNENIELRYLRHSIQDRVPGFLGYNNELEDDKNFMKTKLIYVSDSSTYQLIYNYLNIEDE